MTPKEEALARGERLRVQGRLEEAAEAYSEHLESSPGDVTSRRRLSEVLLEMGRKDAAISQYVKVQEILAEGGDVLRAIAAGVRVLQIDPHFDNPLSFATKIQTEALRDRQKRLAWTLPFRPAGPLANVPLLADLTPSELNAVAGSMKVHELTEGQVVFQQGDAGESVFFVTRGAVEARSGKRKLGFVRRGDCFGEFSFLTKQPRTATVRAVETTELLELSASDMRAAVRSHPRVKDVLYLMYRERALGNVLARSPLFEMMVEEERSKVAAMLELVTLEPGETVLRQGEVGGALYIIKSGKVEVRAESPEGEEIILATLSPHQFFGEVSFLTGVVRTASVVAVEECELLKIGEKKLRRIVEDNLSIMKVLKKYHLDRVMATAETLKTFLKRGWVEGILR